ncbi:Metalloprotease [Trichoderma novae-zelandiae]
MATPAFASAILRGASNSSDPRCGAAANAGFTALSKRLAQEEATDWVRGRRSVEKINVDVYIHIVASSEDDTEGNISDDVVHKQLQVLSADYAPAGIFFSLKSTDRTINAAWANNTDLHGMWSKLRNGNYGDLNLYFVPTLPYYGFCSMPATDEDLVNGIWQDGCTIRSDTVPGGGAVNYNLGKTVTHEVGHWFGLWHTFEGGCDGDGDFVNDTPAQAAASEGCPPEGQDTCPDQPGLDAIHNFMDYSWDACYREFTPGQMNRMRKVWYAYRA